MTEISSTQRSEWAAMLERLTKDHEGDQVTIELLDPTYGDLHEAERLPFVYASYDPRDDVVVVAVGGVRPRYPVVLRHIVSAPVEVSVSDSAARIVDKSDAATVVSFSPAPTTA